jgi:nickel transport protein
VTTVLAAVVVLIGCAVSSLANAHDIVASVFASGGEIEGQVGFSSGGMAKGVLVEVFDANGDKLGETTTDVDGFFTYTPSQRTELIFRADLGGGHVAQAHMAADDVPAGMSADAAAAPDGAEAGALTAEERHALARIVRDEMKPLRREIAQLKEKNDVQSILGGIGYIAGLFGLGFYLAARRRLRQS